MLLKYGYSNQDTEIVRSQSFLKTKILMVFLQTDQEHLRCNYIQPLRILKPFEPTVFSRIIAGGDYSREAIISNIAIIKSNKLNMDFLSVPDLVPSLIFGA